MTDEFTWVVTTSAFKAALERAARGHDISDILLDLWNDRDKSITHIQGLNLESAGQS